MKLAELILSTKNSIFGVCDYWQDEDGEEFCYRDVMEFLEQWNVPDRIERVWFIAHNQPALDRVKAVVEETRLPDDLPTFILVTENEQEVDYSITDNLLALLAGKTIYIEVWYE